MKVITRELLKAVSADLNAAVAEVAKKHGLLIALAGGTFESDRARLKLEVSVPLEGQTPGEGGRTDVKAAQAAADWPKYAQLFGCDPEWLGKSYGSRSKRMTIVGILPSREKNCVLLHDQNGKGFVASPEVVRMQLAREAMPAHAGLPRR